MSRNTNASGFCLRLIFAMRINPMRHWDEPGNTMFHVLCYMSRSVWPVATGITVMLVYMLINHHNDAYMLAMTRGSCYLLYCIANKTRIMLGIGIPFMGHVANYVLSVSYIILTFQGMETFCRGHLRMEFRELQLLYFISSIVQIYIYIYIPKYSFHSVSALLQK